MDNYNLILINLSLIFIITELFLCFLYLAYSSLGSPWVFQVACYLTGVQFSTIFDSGLSGANASWV
jgi:hypothetical protein